MNLDEVLKVAETLRVTVRGHYDESGSTPQELYAFANEIARIEREECAKLCDRQAEESGGQDYYAIGCSNSAYEIRARK